MTTHPSLSDGFEWKAFLTRLCCNSLSPIHPSVRLSPKLAEFFTQKKKKTEEGLVADNVTTRTARVLVEQCG